MRFMNSRSTEYHIISPYFINSRNSCITCMPRLARLDAPGVLHYNDPGYRASKDI